MASTIDAPRPIDPTIITQKKAVGDLRKKVLIFTNNPLKKTEYNEVLDKRFGAMVCFEPSPEVMTDQVARDALARANPSPHYIIREESRLVDAKSKRDLDGLEVVNHPETAARKVIHNISTLKVWIPKWNKDGTLAEIEQQNFDCKMVGYVDPAYKKLRDESVMGWDHLFVIPQLGVTTLSMLKSPWGKISARQLALDEFIQQHFVYEKPQNLQHNRELVPKEGIEFNLDMSVGNFMNRNSCLKLVRTSTTWPLDNIRERILNEGVYFKAGTSRPMRNYFSPPFGGLPLTAKKTFVEETVFMDHDLHHHLIPDLILVGCLMHGDKFVYSTWRMMSEAMTMMFADGFYADTLAKANPEYKKSLDTRIYPLFEAIDLSKASPSGNKEEMMKAILHANVQYAVLGDDSYWKNLLKDGQEGKLTAYKNHFEKFFIGDQVWTNANYENMSSITDFYKTWIDWVGRDQFNRAKLPLLDDIVKKIKARGANMDSFKDVAKHVFDEIIETRIFNKEYYEPVVSLSEEQRLSNGFLRYMIGQMTFYVHYKDIPGIPDKAKALARRLRTTEHFNEESREEIRQLFCNDVMYVLGMNAISETTAENYMDVHPIFPPVYINYSKQESKSVAEAVAKLYGEQ